MKLSILMILPLALLLSACAPEEGDESGNDIVPQSLEVGQAYNLTITEHEDTTKYYSIPVTAGKSYSIDVRNDLSSSNLISVQLIAAGFQREVLSKGRMISFDYAADQAGSLLIKVEGSSRAFFRYHITAHPSVDDGLVQDYALYEPNNSKNAAYPVINGAQYSSSVDMADDFDWYALDVVSGDTLTLWISNSIASAGHLHPQLYDNQGLPLSQENVVSHTTDLNVQHVIGYTGRVFLKIEGQSPGTPYVYDFSMTLAANGG